MCLLTKRKKKLEGEDTSSSSFSSSPSSSPSSASSSFSSSSSSSSSSLSSSPSFSAFSRLKMLLFRLIMLFSVGIAYACFIHFTGLALPCPFRKVTGLLCPACGVTGLCLALLRLDFASAFQENPLLFCLLPLFAWWMWKASASYVGKGHWSPSKLDHMLCFFAIVLLLLWFVLRNWG